MAVVDSFIKMLHHLQEQANIGFKHLPGDTDVSYKAPVKFYLNEVLMGNNSFWLELDGQPLSIVTYNALNYLISKDKRFAKKLLQGFNTLITRSILISGTGEKERNKFFRRQHDKISQLIK
ncbi:MAG: hypothetical protein ABIO81_05370 [Ginsengibacter sp.]